MLFTRAMRCSRFGLSPSGLDGDDAGGIDDDGEGEGEDGSGGGSEILSPEAPDVFAAADAADSVMFATKKRRAKGSFKKYVTCLVRREVR